MTKLEVIEKTEVIEEINLEDGADPGYQLDPAMAAQLLAGGGNANLISAIQGQLEGLIGKSSGYIDSLPKALRNRISYLSELQDQHDELAEKLHEEQVALKRKYEKLWVPLFEKRAAVVQGKVEAPESLGEGEEAEDETESKDEGETDVAGIPDFWLHVLQSHRGWSEEIQDKDAPILSHLVDIRVVNLRDDADASTSNKHDRDTDDDEEEEEGPKGFKIIFEFTKNPYFSNQELVKTYYMVSDDEEDPVLQKATGTAIQWESGKNPGVKLQKKKGGAKGKSKPPTRSTRVPTFFDFFSPPVVPESETELTEAQMDMLQNALEKDYELGELLKDDIIPYAVKWFTGEAADSDEEDDDDEDEEDDEGDENAADAEDDDEDDEQDEAPVKSITRHGKKGGKGAAAKGGDKETPPDCKQQ
ncbi:hypothetical protein ABBQ38_007814 [Trebouxia sp. C0009 RCD-2024]